MLSQIPRALLLLTVLAFPLASQQQAKEVKEPKEPKGPQPPTPLFASNDPLAIRLSADFKTIFKDRDTTEQKWYPASFTWSAGKDSGQMNVELTTRGHYRLKPGTCSFPPLRVRFNKEARQGTLFDKQGTIKLGVHCKTDNKRYEQMVYQEYLVYRAYNAITDSSFRVRFANATYVDSAAGTTIQAPSFFIEDASDLADRMGMARFDAGANFADVDTASASLMSIFFFMIGNTDWSLPYLHNVRVFMLNGGFFTIPYDFDWSGVVDAPYARPDYRLGTRTVRERVWRGPCYPSDVLEKSIQRISFAKDTIYARYKGQEGLDPKLLKESLEYYDEFFKLAADRKSWEREFRGNCH